ncbi:hypothetical protein [Bradyrhizobium sp. ERR14]|uniref:hypothetical protein n=1 Tax=Bradyrhizobium sp. ERR14 TaxID=2663837 RepID=UPI00161F1C36|nr:hypothetical protein [Bradyrhizobium sp. ERR14]MBB4396683.1 hypothetical protein [Bradyrhizobium sp. ERR14]
MARKGRATSETIAAANEKVEKEVARRKRTVRSFPAAPFEDSIDFVKSMFEFGSGEAVRRLSLFDHISKSPDSGASRMLVTNANKYGLIKGNYASETLELTQDGVRTVDPQIPARDQLRAKIKLSIEDIEIFAKLHERFVGRALPAKTALIDTAVELGESRDAAPEAVETFILNARYVGLLAMLSGAERLVSKDAAVDAVQQPAGQATLGALPSSVLLPTTPPAGAVITADHAKFEATCFYISPIGAADSEYRQHSDLFMGTLIEPAVASFGLSLVRADQIDKPGMITKQIMEFLVKARLVIVDMSYHNPNVFYELAIRHMMRLPIVQIVRKADTIPFDVNQMRTVIIDTSDIYSFAPRIGTYQTDISSHIRRALEAPEAVETPISTFFPTLRAALT